MDFIIDDARSFLAAMLYIRMFGTLDDAFTSADHEAGIVMRTYSFGKYIMYVDNMTQGIEFSIYDTANRTAYHYYALTSKYLLKVLGLPDSKFKVERY